ncbi:MAG: Amino-acid acetyltransferase [Opitutia bacterium UBA7350]|nr:MAG: Amino-acid acetyltransferase [Opitutae bacterium UBA7350]
MNPEFPAITAIKPTDLRGILKYVSMFREHVFIIALDGSLVAHENFKNVLLDIAVLRSLHIRVVLVYGIGQQLKETAEARSLAITNPHGESRTDAVTLALARDTSALVNQEIMQGLSRIGLRCANSNALRAKATGIVGGVDQLLSGEVDKLDLSMLKQLFEAGTMPIIAPMAPDRNGEMLRLNSDAIASKLAEDLEASKLIYLTTHDAFKLGDDAIKNLSLEELDHLLESQTEALPDRLLSKLKSSAQTIRNGTPRAHILDGRLFGALLNEVFDKVGIGTMIYGNEYQSIRPANPEEAYSIYNITRNAVRAERLRERDQQEIEANIQDYHVYEIDGSIVACLYLKYWKDNRHAELGSVYVLPFYQGKGVGRRMVQYAINHARKIGIHRLTALSTQAAPFFTEVCSFVEGQIEDLHEEQRCDYLKSGRNSKIFYIKL